MKKLLFLLCFCLFFTGCLTTTTQTKVQPSKAIFLDATKLGAGKKIWLGLKNETACAADLQSLVTGMLTSKGYEITRDAKEADFTLQAQVLFCDHSRENNKVGAGIIGAGTAAAIASYNHAGGWATVGWAALGALAAGTMAHLSEDDTWDLQVSVRVTPKDDTPQETTIFAKASKMNLSGDEAGRALENQVARQIAQMF